LYSAVAEGLGEPHARVFGRDLVRRSTAGYVAGCEVSRRHWLCFRRGGLRTARDAHGRSSKSQKMRDQRLYQLTAGGTHLRRTSFPKVLPRTKKKKIRGGPPIAEALFAHVLTQFSTDPSLTDAESAEEKATYAPLGCGA